jgi:integrase
MGDRINKRIEKMASFKWITLSPGIRCREHETRKHGVKLDRYFTLRFYIDGKRIEEALGWASEGWTLTKAQAELIKLREAKRTGQGETTLAEKRASATTQRESEARRQTEEVRRSVTLFSYFNDTYKPWAEATKAKAFTRELQLWAKWIEPTLGDLSVREIGLDQWDLLVKTLTDAGMSERTREYATGTLRRIMSHAYARKISTAPPPSGRVIGATAALHNRRERVLSDDELHKLLAALKVRDIRAWRATLFAAGTGCRAGEAFALRWCDVDLDRGAATFPKTKNGKPRTVPLGTEIKAMIDDAFSEAKENKKAEPTDLVFPTSVGTRYTSQPTAFRKTVKALKFNEERGRSDRVCFHTLRHTAATKLARVLPLRGLMDVMGWTQVAMAARYTHSTANDMDVAALTLNAALQPSSDIKVVAMAKRGGA